MQEFCKQRGLIRRQKLIIEGVAQQTQPRNKHFLPNLRKYDDKKRGQPIGEKQNYQHFEPPNR